MANVIQRKMDSAADMTITLASLGSGSGRQSTLIANTSAPRPGAIVTVKITTGTSPTPGRAVLVYLIRADADGTPLRDDGAGASDAALTPRNATLLGSISVDGTSDATYIKSFDTAFAGYLGSSWGIAALNDTGATLNATAGNHEVHYQTYYDEIQ